MPCSDLQLQVSERKKYDSKRRKPSSVISSHRGQKTQWCGASKRGHIQLFVWWSLAQFLSGRQKSALKRTHWSCCLRGQKKKKEPSDVRQCAQQWQRNSFPLPSHVLSPYGKVAEGTWRKTHNSRNRCVGKYGFLEMSTSVLIALDVWCWRQCQWSAVDCWNTLRGRACYDTSADDTNLLQSHADFSVLVDRD